MAQPFPDYEQHDALSLAELVKKRELSAREVVDACIARIEQRNPRLNALTHTMFDSARAQADKPLAGPLAGVPFALKDLIAFFAGEPCSFGSRFFRGFVPDHDSELVLRYRRAGLVFVGKTNTPELGIMPYTESAELGVCRNPWDTTRTPGGSSGGAAAAVAAGILPVAHAGDGGGSIRIPAACCGVFGMKPTRGRNPFGPDFGEAWHGAVVEHVVSRTVRDSAVFLDVTHGPDVGPPNVAPAPERPYLDEVARAPGKLRIAYTSRVVVDDPPDAEAIRALEDAVALCRDLGHEVIEATPDIEGQKFLDNFRAMIGAETAADLKLAEKALGKKAAFDDFEVTTWLLAMLGEQYSAAEFAAAVSYFQQVGRVLGRFFTEYDVLLTPTLGTPPPLVGELAPKGLDAAIQRTLAKTRAGPLLRHLGALDGVARRIYRFIPYTFLANVTGTPAMSVPLYWTPSGVPLGVQFMGKFGDEGLLFRLAAQLESARPWRNRWPALVSD